MELTHRTNPMFTNNTITSVSDDKQSAKEVMNDCENLNVSLHITLLSRISFCRDYAPVVDQFALSCLQTTDQTSYSYMALSSLPIKERRENPPWDADWTKQDRKDMHEKEPGAQEPRSTIIRLRKVSTPDKPKIATSISDCRLLRCVTKYNPVHYKWQV